MAITNPSGLVFSGARARLAIDGKPIGYATNCSGSEDIAYEPINVLDHVQTVEFVPTGYTVTFTASRVRVLTRSLKGADLNIFPRTDADAAVHLRNILDMGEMDATIEDSVESVPFMELKKLKVASHSWSVQARGIVGEDMTFVAIRMTDEADTLGQ